LEKAPPAWRHTDWAAAALLFCGTAAVVLWQNSRLGILWDLSYILETAQRIAAGDIPYRDFPLPFAPLTFLTQAAIIKLTGRVFFHHVLYAATAGGLGTVLTWRILLNHLRDKVPAARLCAFLLALPLIFLGIYSIFPHPFYDPDCTLAILLATYLLQRSERDGFPPPLAFCAGAAVVVPVFVKQNAGIAFAAATGLALIALLANHIYRRKSARGILWIVAGATATLAFAVLLLHFTAGLANYWHWTVQFAAARRLPAFPLMLAIYDGPLPLLFSAAFVVGVLLLHANRKSNRRWRSLSSAALLSAPFIWPVIALFVMDNSSDRVEQLLALWPFVLILSFLAALWSFPQQGDLDLAIPFILIAAVNGAFLSQQVWGSTYALWPLFILLLAWIFSALLPAGKQSSRIVLPFVALLSISLTATGAYYAVSHERLDYAKIDEGGMVHSTLPELRGLSVRGQWIPQFEQLVGYAHEEIPDREGVLIIPGEDLFYFTTGRRPQFPALMFDHTLNPYSPEEILEITRSRDIRWLIVKNELQVNGEPVEQKQELLDLLSQDFKPVKTLGIYTIYRRDPLPSK
jgi:hypothetical protein